MSRTLACYDVDDTIIRVDIHIGIKNDAGEVVERITAQEYYERASTGELTADGCCFAEYNCADTFLSTGYFIEPVVEQLRKDLQDPDVDVVLITGRNFPSCFNTYVRKFHNEGLWLNQGQIIFAATNTVGEERTHTHLMKRPHYERLVPLYNRVRGYEDSRKNLSTLHGVCVDFDVPFEGYLILDDGTIENFAAC